MQPERGGPKLVGIVRVVSVNVEVCRAEEPIQLGDATECFPGPFSRSNSPAIAAQLETANMRVPLHRGFDGLNDGPQSTQVSRRAACRAIQEPDIQRRVVPDAECRTLLQGYSVFCRARVASGSSYHARKSLSEMISRIFMCLEPV
jgi:hypothetical protein